MSNEIIDLAPGRYVGKLQALKTGKTVNGFPFVEWDIVVDNGPHENVEIKKRSHPTTRKAADYLKKELAKIGLAVSGGTEFERLKDQAANRRIVFSVKIKDDGTPACHIQGLAPKEPVVAAIPEDTGL